MTDKPAEPQRDADEDDDPDGDTSATAAQPAKKWTPQAIRKAAKERLTGTGHAMVADDGEVEYVVRGARDRTLAALRTAAQQLEKLYENLHANEQVTGLAVGASIHITVGPAPEEIETARAAAAMLESLDEGDRAYAKALDASVPNTVAASAMILDLIELTRDEPNNESLRQKALAYGTGVASNYRVLATQLGTAGLHLEAKHPLEERFVSVEPQRLEEVGRALEAPGTPTRLTVSGVAGTIAMADADRLEFRLRFSDDVQRSDALREWRFGSISGIYTPEMRASLTRRGLWNKEVIATLEITRDQRGTTANRRPPTVRLKSARLRFDS